MAAWSNSDFSMRTRLRGLSSLLAVCGLMVPAIATGQWELPPAAEDAEWRVIDFDFVDDESPILLEVAPKSAGDRSLLAGGSDSDLDGLSDVDEAALGTDPNDVDSDCDGLSDADEVGVDLLNPLDDDADSLIDAIESRWVDSDDDNVADDVDPSSGEWQPSCGRFVPFAVKNDQTESTRLEVRIIGGPPISEVLMDSALYVGDVQVDGLPIPQGGVELFDDGTHGDRIAADRIYTRGGFTSNASTDRVLDRDFDLLTMTDGVTTQAVDLDFIIGGSFDKFRLGVVSAGLVGPTISRAPNARVASHLVNMIEPLVSLEVKKFLMSDPSSLQLATQAFYTAFPDDFDLILMFPESPAVRGSFGVATQAKNEVEGTGRSIFDNTAFWGSAGRLGSVVARNFGNNGPTLHEIMHRWGVRLSTALGFQQCAGGHWGVAGVGRAQLGGFDPATLVDEGGGQYTVDNFSTFASGGDGVDYSMLELYLAGFASEAEVPDIPIPQNVDCGSFVCDDPSCSRLRFSAGVLETVTIDDIIATHGPRVPDFSTAPTHFDASLVVFSQKALSDTEMAYFNVQSMELGDEAPPGFPKSFAEATLGRGSMSTVPEPGGVVSLLTGIVLLGCIRRRGPLRYRLSRAGQR